VKEVLHHYVVLIKTTDKYIEIMDPGDGAFHKIEHEEFKKTVDRSAGTYCSRGEIYSQE